MENFVYFVQFFNISNQELWMNNLLHLNWNRHLTFLKEFKFLKRNSKNL